MTQCWDFAKAELLGLGIVSTVTELSFIFIQGVENAEPHCGTSETLHHVLQVAERSPSPVLPRHFDLTAVPLWSVR